MQRIVGILATGRGVDRYQWAHGHQTGAGKVSGLDPDGQYCLQHASEHGHRKDQGVGSMPVLAPNKLKQ